MNSMFLIIGSVFTSLIFISGAVEYSNRWTVQINGDVGEAERLAVKHGFVNQGKKNYPVPSSPSVPLYGHGEKCAGVIAAVLNNSHCGVGLAYKSKLAGIRLFFDSKASDADEARALSHATDHIDIYSNSWGPDIKGFNVIGPGPLTQRALQSGAEKGRRKRGSIYVFAVGNGGFLLKNSCAFNGYVNSIYTIGITGINSDGSIPSYGEHCAGIMAVTYSKDGFGVNDNSKVVGQTW
ncbi:PREDICTED: furin-like protease kpc-1 [Acropora digitifera]|uniref:furin-like protease kpc-1 n=1 Tax=Acropora digitifera TaxID=70779 RepID=UPI00077A16A7|nr:PREDICTED: furin-like protease kpc-1 [Acropora digitifera]